MPRRLLIWTALEALRHGTSVVLDFGFWARDERSALRWLAGQAGATCHVVYLPIGRTAQLARIARRQAGPAGPPGPATAGRRCPRRWPTPARNRGQAAGRVG